MESIRELLDEEIQVEFEKLSKLEIGSESYKATVDGLSKLVDRAVEIDKTEMENATKIEAQNIENDFKALQIKEDNRDRWVRNGIAIAGIIIPSVLTVWGTLKSFKFEETGTVTTILGRGFINKLLPKK